MTTSEKIKIVKETVRLYKEFSDASDAFCKIVSGTIEGGVLDKAWRAVEFHRRHTAQLIGDNAEWLEWYIYECDCGAKPMRAKHGGRWRTIATEKDLVRLIEATK